VIATITGWLAASLAATLALVAWRLLAVRMEAVARASHQLRGPLTAARLGLQLEIRSGSPPADRLRAIDVELGSAALALEDLAGAASRWRAPAADVAAMEEIELRELVADSVEAWRALADATGVDLRIRWSGGPGPVIGDRLRLAQATGNLIANAIEHGGGQVEIRGTHHRGAIRLEVIDGGSGLPAPVSELARRAGRGRSRAERDRKRAGRGRGLAIAVAVAEVHGGRLAAAPSKRGARLVLELPAARRGAPASGSEAAPEDRPAPA
jgi:signal transduction histidine kinase